MSEIEKIIKMLQSPKLRTRYEAFELLRVAPPIASEAITALQHATSDRAKHRSSN